MPPEYTAGSAYHQARRWTNASTVKCLETAVKLFGTPQSLVDIGCAEGVTVRWAQAQGIDAMGVDLAVPDGDPRLVRADLRERLDLGRRFQWVLCWEVAEHLDEEFADRLVATLVRHVTPHGRILFTAARPGQGGPGHVNEQSAEYWMDKFFEHGLTWADGPSHELRRVWLKAAPRASWYGRNAAVYWRTA